MIQQGKDTLARLFPLAPGGPGCALSADHPSPDSLATRDLHGRALADNDPAGIGRDLMFRLDGQSAYSLFPALPHFWSTISACSTPRCCWSRFLASVWFAARSPSHRRRRRSAGCRSRASSFSRRRPMARSTFSTSARVSPFRGLSPKVGPARRRDFSVGPSRVAFAPLVAAGLFHPIMALGGAAVLVLCLCFEDRRGFVVLASSPLCPLLIAAFMGLPLVDRLRATIDADWLELLQRRHKYLFPHLWPQTAWTLPAVQAITILIAARVVSPGAAPPAARSARVRAWRRRRLVSVRALDPALLVMRAQFWRMWWLTGVLSALSLGLVNALNATDNGERLSVAILALAWCLWQDAGIYAPAVAALALLVSTLRLPVSQDVSARHLARRGRRRRRAGRDRPAGAALLRPSPSPISCRPSAGAEIRGSGRPCCSARLRSLSSGRPPARTRAACPRSE